MSLLELCVHAWLGEGGREIKIGSHPVEVMNDVSRVTVTELGHWDINELHPLVLQNPDSLLNPLGWGWQIHLVFLLAVLHLVVFLTVVHPTEIHPLLLNTIIRNRHILYHDQQDTSFSDCISMFKKTNFKTLNAF